MVCLMPVIHNYTNYKDDVDHDKNTRKYWFVVFGKGLYTKKTDADVVAGHDDGVHIFNTHAQASRAWARHCRRRHSAGCHETKDPATHASDADSDADKDTEELCARARVPDHAARQRATGKRSKIGMEGVKREPQKERQVKQEPLKHMRQASTVCAASVPVKEEAVPLRDTDDSDPEILKTDLSLEVPLAASLAALRASSRATSALPGLTVSLAVSRANSRARSALSSLEEDEDVPMPAAPIVSPTVSSVSSLSATSAAPSAFSSITGALRAATPVRAAVVAPSTPRPMVFNRKTHVLYDDLEAAVKEKQPGESVELVQAAEVMLWIRLSVKMLYNRRTHVLYDDLKAAVDEREPGDSMQVVEPGEGVEWISTLGR
ncbi:hypothetical protein B0H14DRAFT_3509077 [Mycena olivaceomarginata]|nr:hypothetical protein B0H14DRAFT_3509077 [Mycena olivaceomarginata]